MLLAERVLAGDLRAAARLMRNIDDQLPSVAQDLSALFPHTGRATVIGITGNPGSGKSTLTDQLIARALGQGKTVGVVAVDPTSPFSGGAILGDRIRMQQHATDPRVFIRSLATRGHLGGLSRSTSDVVRVLDAMGKELILVETVGVGQDEVEVASLAHTTVVVVVPGLGDDVQAIKAGILEVADVFALNKSDREGVDRTERDLVGMLELRRTGAIQGAAPGPLGAQDAGWEPPIVRTVATTGEGVEALGAAIERHLAHLAAGGRRAREVRRAKGEFLVLLRERLMSAALARLTAQRGRLEELAEKIADRAVDPYKLVDEVADAL